MMVSTIKSVSWVMHSRNFVLWKLEKIKFWFSQSNTIIFFQYSRSARSLNPKPPSSLWWHNLFHDCQYISLVYPHKLHQSCATALVNFFVTVFSIWKKDIIWFGNEVTTEFIITSFSLLCRIWKSIYWICYLVILEWN